MNITLKKAIDGFKLSNEARGLSLVTVDWYNRNLLLFLKWVAEKFETEPQITDITAVMVREYLYDIRAEKPIYEDHPYRKKEKRQASPRTVQGYFSSLNAFFNWAVVEELLEDSPTRKIKRPKAPKFIPDPFTEEEVRLLLKAAKSMPDQKSIRLLAILLFFLDTGVRMKELLSMKIEDVQLDLGRAKIMGKGAKERYVFFGRITKKALWRYISLVRPEPRPNVTNVFLVSGGWPIPPRRLAHMFEELGKKAGVEKVKCHRMRRYAAIQFLKHGGGELALQKMLGHETLEMVRRYVNLASDDVQEAHRRASPMDNLRT